MSSRLKNIYSQLRQRRLDGLLVSLPANISYLTEFLSRDSYLLVSEKENIYFTDSRYTEEAKSFLKGKIKLKECNGWVFQRISEISLRLGLKRLGFEERYLPFAEYNKIRESLNGRLELVPTHSIVEDKRQIKDAQEIQRLKQATKVTALALGHIKKF
ncbi:MAG: aminopeptidase P family N-terminal domain-containing protein, partial [Candidatus Omnitrophota bacterium]